MFMFYVHVHTRLFVVYANLKCLVKVNEQKTVGKKWENKKIVRQFHIESKLLPSAPQFL